MAGSDFDWAGYSVPWNSELPVFEASHNLLLEAGPWTVPYSDFTPPASPFALEMRAETIEQLAGGDALRRGESERIEAGHSETNADLVAGRDRVRVQGTLHEHTGHGLVEQAAHLDTTVDARLDVDAGSEDTVLLAGHMKDAWDGGTAIVAAMTDDLVAGGGVRVTAPLDLWMHGLMGVEERIGTCTADAVLLELGATHYEREYGPGVHAAGLASYTGSLYQSNRSTFRALMRVSSGVRNLIAGGGSAGAGGAPDASPPPAPAAGDAGTGAVADTLSTATGGTRSVESVVESGPRSESLTDLHRISDGSDLTLTEDFMQAYREIYARYREIYARMDETLASAGGTNFAPLADDLSGLTRSADSAEQLTGLQRGEFPVAGPGSTHPPAQSGADVVHHAGGLSDAHPPVPGLDRPHTGSSEAPSWHQMFSSLTKDFHDYRWSGNQPAADAHQAAIDAVADMVLTAFTRTGGNVEELPPARYNFTQAMVIRHKLDDMADQARRTGDWRHADKIAQTLQEIDQYTYQTVVRLSDPGSALDTRRPLGTPDARVGSTTDEPAIAGHETVRAGDIDPGDPGSGHAFVGDGSYRIPSDSDSVASLDGDSSLHSESGHDSPPIPAATVVHVADPHGTVILRRNDYKRIRRGIVSLQVVDADGHELAKGSYTLVVPGYDIGETGVLYRRLHRYDDVIDLSTSFLARLSDDPPALRTRIPEALEVLDPTSLAPRAPVDPDASRLAGLTEVDEARVGLTGHGGSPDTNRGNRRVRFGRPQVYEYERWRPGFGGADAPRDGGYEFSIREDVVQNLMGGGILSDDEIEFLRRRYVNATSGGEVDRSTELAFTMGTLVYGVSSRDARGDLSVVYGGFQHIDWNALDAVLQLFDAPRPNRVGRDLPV